MDKQKKKIAEQILSWSEDEVAELLKLYDKKHITQHKKDISKPQLIILQPFQNMPSICWLNRFFIYIALS